MSYSNKPSWLLLFIRRFTVELSPNINSSNEIYIFRRTKTYQKPVGIAFSIFYSVFDLRVIVQFCTIV